MRDSRPRLTVREIERRVRIADPAAFLLLPRILRRVIRLHCGLTGWVVPVPRRRALVMPGDALLRHVTRRELGLTADQPIPARVLLLEAPDPARIRRQDPDRVLLDYWRSLFHVHVHASLDDRRFTQAMIRERIAGLGQNALDEIRAVLQAEGYLLPIESDLSVYATFAAVFLELRCFAPQQLAAFFPNVAAHESWERLLRRDVDVDTVLERTRLEGADRRLEEAPAAPAERQAAPPDPRLDPRLRFGARQRLLTAATRSRGRSNLVRSAILRTRAAWLAEPETAADLRAEARIDVAALVDRMRTAVGLPDADREPWCRLLAELLEQTPHRLWTHEARFLYDLQKVCLDRERGVRGTSVARWLVTFGRTPIERPLPHLQEVLLLRHLKRASRRLPRLRLGDRDWQQLDRLLRERLAEVEQHLRRLMRPDVISALRDAGFVPRHTPERIAVERVADELLDFVAEQGYLSLPQVRDALSRNEIKLPHCAELAGWWRDRLLAADERLATALDGVYRRGESYLRGLQRMSALAFGTHIGRWLSLYVVLPFGSAFVVLEGIKHLVGPAIAWATGSSPHFIDPIWVVCLGALVLGMAFIPEVRTGVVAALRVLGRAARIVFVEWPNALLAFGFVRRFLTSRLARDLKQYGLLPLLLAAALWTPLLLMGVATRWLTWLGVLLYAASALFLNTPPGRALLEITSDAISRSWERLRSQLLVGLVRWTVDVFQRLVGTLDRALYEVDEWLRFRVGERRYKLWIKASLGLVWAVIAYLVRFYVNLLIEPQVNPVKHFPVVTVSHKVILPLLPTITDIIATALTPLGTVLSYGIAVSTVFLLPGVFGFLVWELKENWKLFEINRPPDLRPQTIGSHGETMTRFLKPGFHSGTLPKSYTRLRRAAIEADATHGRAGPRRWREAIHHVEVAVRHFAERDLIRVLELSMEWQGYPVSVRRVQARANCIRIELAGRDPDRPALLSFEEQNGLLVAGLLETGWLDELGPRQRRALRNALVGHYHHAGVALLREEIEARLGKPTPPYDIARQGLVVWPGPGYEREIVYDLETGVGHSTEGEQQTLPEDQAGAPRRKDTLQSFSLRFDRTRVPWEVWVEAWQDDLDPDLDSRELGAGRVLPPLARSRPLAHAR